MKPKSFKNRSGKCKVLLWTTDRLVDPIWGAQCCREWVGLPEMEYIYLSKTTASSEGLGVTGFAMLSCENPNIEMDRDNTKVKRALNFILNGNVGYISGL
jgi:hypothetical protein